MHNRNKISCPSRKLLFRQHRFPVRVVLSQIPDSELPVTCFPDIADYRQFRMKAPRSVFVAQQETAASAPAELNARLSGQTPLCGEFGRRPLQSRCGQQNE